MQEAELAILYNFYIDCMPSDDMAEASWSNDDVERRRGGSFSFCSCCGRETTFSAVPDRANNFRDLL